MLSQGLKGHATLWWDELQADRRCKGKQKIKSWDRMIAKMKEKFIPRDYQITLFQKNAKPETEADDSERIH
jgi:hypothetical protein